MAGTDATSAANEAKPKLEFHYTFANPTPGSVILQSDGARQTCFYAPLPLLAQFSSFFSNLPPPSSADLVNGHPLIPLSDATFLGLRTLLPALDSTLSPEPYRFSPMHPYDMQSILDAALIAKKYDIPIIFRVLDEALQNAGQSNSRHLPLIFAIWSIAGLGWKIASAAEATVNNYDITRISKKIVAALAHHAPDAITQLQSLQLRSTAAPSRLLEACRAIQTPDCSEGNCGRSGRALDRRFREALQGGGLAEVKAAEESDYGLECEGCLAAVGGSYRILLEWYHKFAARYAFEQDYEEYKKTVKHAWY